jgi:hypothetical protein
VLLGGVFLAGLLITLALESEQDFNPSALGEQLFDVAVGEAEAQVLVDRQHDHVRWEAKASEGGS